MPLIADFPVTYRLSSPSSRPPRLTADAVSAAFGEQARFLGAGAFGETWRLGDSLAAKIIVEEAFAPERIEREIEAARVDHPNVVKLEKVRELEIDGEQRVVLVFRFVKGKDLAHVIIENGPLSEGELGELARTLFAGLSAIHTERVIHRDLKPENIQLRMGSPAQPVILDLGLARVATLSSLTTYPNAIGTRAFMPPEVLRGEQALARSDIFALGVTLYIAATGQHPWLKEGHQVTNVEFAEMIAAGAPSIALRDAELSGVLTASLHPKAFRRPSAAAAVRALGGSS